MYTVLYMFTLLCSTLLRYVTLCYVYCLFIFSLTHTCKNTNTHTISLSSTLNLSIPHPPHTITHTHTTHTHTHTHTGRSKEIINRGGETISPFEIEEAVQQYPTVKEVLAFSAPHAQVRHVRNMIYHFLDGPIRDIILNGCVW
jgi:hypothetical protein